MMTPEAIWDARERGAHIPSASLLALVPTVWGFDSWARQVRERRVRRWWGVPLALPVVRSHGRHL